MRVKNARRRCLKNATSFVVGIRRGKTTNNKGEQNEHTENGGVYTVVQGQRLAQGALA
jgi:hypothetical protein